EAWMRADLARPVDLSRGPALVVALLRLAVDRVFMYLRAHHIVLDGYAAAMLVRRGAEHYTALVESTPTPPGSDRGLALLVHADPRYRSSSQFTRDREYWAQHLEDLPAATSLAAGAASPSRNFLRHTGHLPAVAVDQLQAAARR